MDNWTQALLVVAVIAAIMAFGGFAGAAVGLAKVMFVVCLVLGITSLLRGRKRSA